MLPIYGLHTLLEITFDPFTVRIIWHILEICFMFISEEQFWDVLPLLMTKVKVGHPSGMHPEPSLSQAGQIYRMLASSWPFSSSSSSLSDCRVSDLPWVRSSRSASVSSRTWALRDLQGHTGQPGKHGKVSYVMTANRRSTRYYKWLKQQLLHCQPLLYTVFLSLVRVPLLYHKILPVLLNSYKTANSITKCGYSVYKVETLVQTVV